MNENRRKRKKNIKSESDIELESADNPFRANLSAEKPSHSKSSRSKFGAIRTNPNSFGLSEPSGP